MQTISATYRVTTPMFIGGISDEESEEHRVQRYSPDHPAELRLPSFKGALRFWWRALAWDHCRDVQQLRQEEAALFGCSDEAVGQSKVLMRLHHYSADVLRPDIKEKHQLKDAGKIVGEGARYLGYGVMEAFKRKVKDKNRNVIRETEPAQLTRSCLLAPFSFTVELLFKPDVSDEQRGQIRKALMLLGMLGGLGSKARKGYGSLTLTSLRIKQKRDEEGTEDWKPPEKPQELVKRLSDLLCSSQIRGGNADASVFDNLPEWTAFSPASRILVLSPDGQDRTPLALLDRVGREMVRYRSWGHHGRVLGGMSEKNFTDDHDLMKQDWKQRQSHPRRVVFGLPHNYGKPPTEHVEPAELYDRRASPLILHVHQNKNDSQPLAILTFLPSLFLPAQARGLSVGKRERQFRGSGDWEKQIVPLADDYLWTPMEDFLDRLSDQNQREEPFGTALEVKHG